MKGLKHLFCKETLLLPIYVFCLVKLIVRISNDDHMIKKSMRIALRTILTLILVPSISILLLGFAITSDLVRVLAKLYYGERYVESAKGADSAYATDRRDAMGIVPVVVYIEGDAAFAPRLMQLMRHRVQRMQTNHPRLASTLENFLGYYFYVRATHIQTDDILSYFDDYTSPEEFDAVLNKKLYVALPGSNRFLWDCTIGRTPIVRNGKTCIPLSMRFHHSIGDGVTLLTLLATSVGDNGVDIVRRLCDDLYRLMRANVTKPKDKPDLLKMLNNLWNTLWHKEFYFAYDMLRGSDGANALHTGVGKEASLIIQPAGGEEFVGKLRAIKTKLNVVFNDVILGALGAALTEFFVKRNEIPPKSILTGNPYFLQAGKFNELLTFNKQLEPITKLGNKFTVAFINVELNKDLLSDPKQFVLAQNKTTIQTKNSMDFTFAYWILNQLISITPSPIVRHILNFYDSTAIVSNVPPFSEQMIIDGHAATDIKCSSIHVHNVATTFAFYKYHTHFNMSTFVNKDYMTTQEQKSLIENFVKYVDQIYAELHGL